METRMMPEFLLPYGASFAAWLCAGGAYLVQALVADLAAIRAHHTPGMPVASGHDDFLFRATRAHANTNESLAAFVVLSLAAMFLGASPWWTNGLAWGFAIARVGHMVAYYGDQRLFRSVAFSVGFACLVGLLVVGLVAVGAGASSGPTNDDRPTVERQPEAGRAMWSFQGGCYCGALRYHSGGDALLQGATVESAGTSREATRTSSWRCPRRVSRRDGGERWRRTM